MCTEPSTDPEYIYFCPVLRNNVKQKKTMLQSSLYTENTTGELMQYFLKKDNNLLIGYKEKETKGFLH